MGAKATPSKRQKPSLDVVFPSKKAKKEEDAPKVEEKAAEPVQTAKKDKKKQKQNKDTVEPPAKKEKKEVEAVEVKSVEKKQKGKKDKKKSKVEPEVASEDAYVPGALSALFGGEGGGAGKAAAAPKEDDLFGKYENADNGFVDVPTVIGQVEKKADKPEENLRKKQRENRKKNLHDPSLVDERKRTVFVGNLPADFTVKQLRKIFSECGKIENVRLRGTVGSKETLSKKTAFLSGKVNENIKSIVGYVKFLSVDTVAEAIKKNGTVVDGHHLRVDGCVDIKNYDRKSTVFVGNLPFEIADDDLIEWAETCVGPVDFVRVVRDRNTGYGRGVGFITFKDNSSVAAALALATPVIGGNDVRLQKVMKKSEKKELRKGDGARAERRKAKKAERGKAKKGGGGGGGAVARIAGKHAHSASSQSGPVNPLLGPSPAHASKRVQKEIKKRRKMAGPKSLMK